MAKLPCPPQSRIYTLKDTGETMSYDQVREYLMSNPELWSGKAEVKEGPLSSVEATAKALKEVDNLKIDSTTNKTSQGEGVYIDAKFGEKGNIQWEIPSSQIEAGNKNNPQYVIVQSIGNQKESQQRGEGSQAIASLFNKYPSLQEIGYDDEAESGFWQKIGGGPDILKRQDFFKYYNKKAQSISEAYHAAKKDGTNPELVKAVEELLGEKAEGKEAAPNSPEGIAARIRNKKQRGALSAIDFGISVTVYNGALEFMASQVEKGTKLGNAIANTIKWIDDKMKGEKWNKGAFGKYMNDTYKVTLGDGREVEVVRDDSKETAEVINGWYQPIEQKVLDSKEESLPANKWAERLKSKEDEDLWTGVRAFLEEKGTERVSRKELLDFIKDNRIEIVTVVKREGGKKPFGSWRKISIEFGRNGWLNDGGYKIKETPQGDYELIYTPNRLFAEEESLGRFDIVKEAEDVAEKHSENLPTATKFASYQLPGDKENYKEVLVTLPKKLPIPDGNYIVYADKGAAERREYIKGFDTEKEAFNWVKENKDKYPYTIDYETRKIVESIESGDVFKSSHFDEPNILVHLRMNTRTDADGNKVLFLEEVQSDWGQKGKKEGFRQDFDKNKVSIEWTPEYGTNVKGEKYPLKNSFTILYDGNPISGKIGGYYETDQDALNYAIKVAEKDFEKRKETKIPTAPFVMDTNAWVKLGLKTALQEAVRQGADKIAWTTGEQQNDRYDLSKQLSSITIDKTGQNSYMVMARSKGDERLVVDQSYRKEELPDIIGKELAADMVAEADKLGVYGGTVYRAGDGLSIGGKGMKGFYGSAQEGSKGIIGGVAEKLFGQKVGTAEIEGNPQSSISITPELKAQVEKGLPLFGTQLTPEQELKQAFDKWRSETGKLGIVPNWERQAKADIELFNAAKKYLLAKIGQGAYAFEQFLKDLTKVKVENVEEDRDKWESLYNKVIQEAKPLEGKAVKAAVEKAAGIRRSTKSEVQRIIDRAFAIGMGMGTKEGFVKGATAGMKAGAVEGRTQAVDMLRNALANLSGELTPKQVSAIVERMGRLKTFSEAAKQSFIDYADKVIEDANYAAKEKKAAEIKKAVKQISNRSNVAANDQSLYKSLASLSISHLTPSDLEKFTEWGTKIKNRALKPGDRAQLASFIEQAQQRQNAIVQERSEKMKEGRMRNLRAEFDEMEAAGTLPNDVTTFDEYVAFKKPKPKGETLEDKITAIEERLNEIPEGENEMIDKLRNADLSVLNKEDLTLIDNSLYNYIDTGKLYGIGDPLVKAEYLGKVKDAVEAGLKTRRQVDRKDAEKLGMSNLFTTLGETKDVAAKLRGLLIQPWLSAATKANSKYIEIETALMAKADKLKIKQPNWNRIDLFGFLNEGEGNPELFEKLKEQKLSDLETLRERVAKNVKDKDNSATAKAQEYAYNALKEAAESLGFNENSTLESIRDKMSDNEIQFYNETRRYLDQYSPKALENMELYGNKEVGITKNYWPRTTNKINERQTGIDVFDLYGSDYVGKNMFGREKGRSRLLGKAGYYTPVGQENYFNGLKETMLIAEAAHEYHGMQALYNTPEKGFGQLIKGNGAGDIKQLMIDWIMDTKNVGRYQGGVSKINEDILNAIQKGFTRSLINNPTQVVKQPTALAYTFAEAPKPTFKAVGLIAQAMMEGKDSPLAKAINGLFETTTLGQRLYHPEMIEVKEKYTIDKPETLRSIQQILKGFNARLGGDLLVPVDAVVSQVATLAGYIQQAEKSGKEFNIFYEQAKGYDMVAAAAADQMQAKTNNENAAIYFSKKQLNNRALYYLGNFQANAVRNLYISIRKIVSGRTKQEVQEGFQGVAGYVLSASLFAGAGMLTSYATSVTAFALYQGIMNALGDTEDDEEERRRILKWLDSRQLLSAKRRVAGEVVGMLTGAYGILARAALEATLATLEQAYYRKTEEEEKPSDRIFFTPEVSGYAGVVADNIISPIELTAKATDPQEEVMAQTGLLAAKALGQSAMGFYVQNLLNAKKFKEKEAKASKEEQTKTLEQKAFPKRKKLAEAKKQWTKSIEQGDAVKARAAFNEVVKLSDDTPYITAIELRKSFYKDNVKPSIINEGDEFIWLSYILNGKNGDVKIGEQKLKDLIPPSERQKYIDQYKSEFAKVQKMASIMNKTIIVKNSRGKIVDWTKPYDWAKRVQDKMQKK